jgi:hypothetical protein
MKIKCWWVLAVGARRICKARSKMCFIPQWILLLHTNWSNFKIVIFNNNKLFDKTNAFALHHRQKFVSFFQKLFFKNWLRAWLHVSLYPLFPQRVHVRSPFIWHSLLLITRGVLNFTLVSLVLVKLPMKFKKSFEHDEWRAIIL